MFKPIGVTSHFYPFSGWYEIKSARFGRVFNWKKRPSCCQNSNRMAVGREFFRDEAFSTLKFSVIRSGWVRVRLYFF